MRADSSRPESVLRVLHVSDYHASQAKRSQQERVVGAFLEDVGRLHDTRAVDLVVFSGDLADQGRSDEFNLATTTLLTPLLSRLGLPAQNLILVPGNHDVDRGQISRPMERGLQTLLSATAPDAARAELELLFSQPRPELDQRRLAAWDDFFKAFYLDASEPPVLIAPHSHLHVIQTRAGVVKVLGLNTAWRSSSDEDRGRLVVGLGPLERGMAELEGAVLQIVVMHHPLEWLADWDSNDLRRTLERHRAIVLSGHEHVPNPIEEFSSRGSAVYARGGCLYDHPTYHNGYAMLDINVETGHVKVKLRAWFGQEHDRHAFGSAENLAEGGTVELRLLQPNPSAVSDSAGFNDVLTALADVLDERSLPTTTPAAGTSLIDRLVAPRFWPVPYSEVTALRIQDHAPEPFRPLEMINSSTRCVVIAGDLGQGVTSALIWLLSQQFASDASRFPAFLGKFDRIDAGRLDKAVKRELARSGVTNRRKQPPPMIVAIDDVDFADARSIKRLADYASARPDWVFLVGTHQVDEKPVRDTFRDNSIALEFAYLGPLGRREARELVAATVGKAAESALVDRVLTVIIVQKLPRHPLTMSALAIVLAESSAAGITNQSALLEAYVGLFLGSGEALDYSRVGMDFRARVHLLGWFAALLNRTGVTALPRAQAELRFAEYFEARLMATMSPGAVLQDLVNRRILRDLEGQVDFRSPALLDLFCAMWMREDEGRAFREEVLQDPLAHERVAAHYSGLKRDSRDLLDRVGRVASEAVEALQGVITLETFDLVSDRPGWSRRAPDVESLHRLRPPPERRRDNESMDERFERYAASLEEEEVTNADLVLSDVRDPIDLVLDSVQLLSTVLSNSELVSDQQLRRRLFIAALRSWSLVLVGVALREDVTSELAGRVEALVGAAPDDSHTEASDGKVVEGEVMDDSGGGDTMPRQLETLVTLVQCVVTTQALAAQHVEQLATEALDDDELMSESAPALLGTMLYCFLQLNDPIERLRALKERHGDHPIVARIVRAYALADYHSKKSVSQGEKAEALLVDIYVERAGVGRGASGRERTAARARVRAKLRASRNRYLRALTPDSDALTSDEGLGGL